MFDTLPVEIVDKIIDMKQSIENEDELKALRRPVDHTDLPLLNEFTFMKHMERMDIDNEYLNLFKERQLLLMFLRASETVILTFSKDTVVYLVKWVVFSGNHNPYDTDSLKNIVDERLELMCELFSSKFGITNPVESEIVVRRLIKKQIMKEYTRPIQNVVQKYKKLFDKIDFQLRYYNDV